MLYYLLDSCSYVKGIKFLNSNKLKHDFITAAKKETAGVFMPQFCVAEVFNIFARMHFTFDEITYEEYKNLCQQFIKNIKNRSLIYIYDLHRYHNIQTENFKIYEIGAKSVKKDIEKYNEDKTKHKYLSGFDGLIIAMALELRHKIYKNPDDEIIILSEDERLREVANQLFGLKAESIFK